MKIKLVVAPYYFYNAFMPPLGIAIVSSVLNKHGIKHEIDDLYVKLYHALKKGQVDINVFLDLEKVSDFIKGVPCEEIKIQTDKIMKLTNFSGYDCVCFSRHYPPLDAIHYLAIIACLIKEIKDKYKPLIITNFSLKNYTSAQLIDFQTEDIDAFIGFLNTKRFFHKKQRRLSVKPQKKLKNIFARPNFQGLNFGLYKYDINTPVCEFTRPVVMKQNLHKFRSISKSLPALLPYIFIDGCQGKCIFCEFSGKAGFRVKGLDEAARDLEFLSVAHRSNNFIFLNSNINPTRQIALDFTKKIIKQGIKIKFTDCANFKNLDEELLISLKEAGAVRLVIGLESASLRIQKYVGKIIDLNHASNILKICYKLGIWVEVDLLVGLPHESGDDIISTLNFLTENYRYIRNINLNRFFLKSRSLMYRYPEKYKIRNLKFDTAYGFGYDEVGGLRWEIKRKLMEYRYFRFLSCMHPNKVDYLRPSQFVFMVNKHFKDIKARNNFLDNVFFKGDQQEKVNEFISELKNGEDIIKICKMILK